MESFALDNDFALTPNDIGQLENAEEIILFFAKLRYNTDQATPVTAQALGMDSAYLVNHIRQIWQIATDPDEEEIQVYLFEVRSVTQQLIQNLARRFRERTESVLLVLTSDYDSLDFVLLERDIAPSKGFGQSLRQVIRPRVLTVPRRNPGPVAIRVLKRFTFTEADGIYQWDKLRSAFTLAEWSEQYFNNRALFSDYYLKHRLTDEQYTAEWKEDVRPIGREVHRLLANARQTYSRQAESVIRQGIYEPLFARLGFDPVEGKRGASADEEADYRLYAPGDRSKPLALALTYVWDRNLDDVDEKRDQETPDEIPGAMVVSLLEKAEAPWAIVTNGKLWRLYSASASNKATNYYEVDLEEAINAADGSQVTAIKYWWLFFRSEAFTGFLDDLLQRSSDYAKELGDRLKDRVFESIFPHFAKGFVENMRAQGHVGHGSGVTLADQKTVPTDLDTVFQATMTFLYRLMFVLYAESLELLPIYEERGYRALSLYKLKREIAEKAGDIEDSAPAKLVAAYNTTSTALYTQLHELFNAISKGEPKLNLPQYNGHLFTESSENGSFLARFAIPDRYLALGLDRLARDVDARTHALALIDYKDLGVRHLGSIYEGLLEFKLRLADEKLAVVKEGGKEIYLPEKKTGGKRVISNVAKGEVYLQNDKLERKATGSYYTPDYIVKYIVEHTVGPVLDRKFDELTPRLRESQRQFQDHKKRVEQRGNDQPADLFWRRPEIQRLADDCLDIRVLDPAMGSGHFLVEVVDYVSNRLITFLNGWSDNPVWAMLKTIREDIVDEMTRQGVSIDVDRLTRVALLKRAVLKRCIYGVDLNSMAVELAKVSLWLDAFTLGAPLSFLDHHLKHGNSLIGSRVEEVRQALVEGQISLFATNKFAGVMLATDLMRQVSYLSDNTVAQVEESRSAYESARDQMAPFKRILDVYTSRWFGNEPSKKGTDPALEFLQRDDIQEWLEDPTSVDLPADDYMKSGQIAETSLSAAADYRFFHWELEFPEIFFAPSTPGGQDVNLKEDGGFDAVVGNPPYVNAMELSRDLSTYVKPYWKEYIR
jgi:hypothetical protein